MLKWKTSKQSELSKLFATVRRGLQASVEPCETPSIDSTQCRYSLTDYEREWIRWGGRRHLSTAVAQGRFAKACRSSFARLSAPRTSTQRRFVPPIPSEPVKPRNPRIANMKINRSVTVAPFLRACLNHVVAGEAIRASERPNKACSFAIAAKPFASTASSQPLSRLCSRLL
jgi:hypothetical protein